MGDGLLGDNSSGKANILWDKSAGTLNFRGGTTVHTYIDTTGELKAGSGAVTLGQDGIAVEVTSSVANIELQFLDTASDRVGYISGAVIGTSPNKQGYLQLEAGDGTDLGILNLKAGAAVLKLETSSTNDFAQFDGDWFEVQGDFEVTGHSTLPTFEANVATFTEQGSTPSTPDAGTEVKVYMKDDKLVFMYYTGITTYYKYLDLASTSGAWTHTIIAP